jgi:uncharacterized protein (TIGR02246 family)
MTRYRLLHLAPACFCIVLAIGLTSCKTENAQQSSPAAVDNRAQGEAEIRALDADWSKAAQAKDLQKIMTFYADTASMLEPGASIAKGRDEIQKRWQATFAAPGSSLTFAPTSITVASSGDLAYDLGTYDFTAPGKKGKPQTMKGIYVVVWAKQPGAGWRVILDGPTSTTP